LDTLNTDLGNKIPFAEKGEVLKLVAGLQLVYHMASGEEFPPREQLNFVLRKSLGVGYSWFTCMQVLSGARARKVFADRQELFRHVGGVEFMRFANHVLPDMQTNFYKIFAPQHAAAT
jgi:hypothetical protein